MSHAQPVPGLQLVKPSEMGNGAIVAGEARVGSGHYAFDPRPPSTYPVLKATFLVNKIKSLCASTVQAVAINKSRKLFKAGKGTGKVIEQRDSQKICWKKTRFDS